AGPVSWLGVRASSLPLMHEQGLPLGLQVTGFNERDAAAAAIASWVEKILAAKFGANDRTGSRGGLLRPAMRGGRGILALTVLAGLVSAPAAAEELKLWRHGIVEA